tara:strand:+ start:940 stop:1167 length:228 start_codon:yes stop_codon:yes gene_type:complete
MDFCWVAERRIPPAVVARIFVNIRSNFIIILMVSSTQKIFVGGHIKHKLADINCIPCSLSYSGANLFSVLAVGKK